MILYIFKFSLIVNVLNLKKSYIGNKIPAINIGEQFELMTPESI